MGRMHYRCWKAMAGVDVAAICDADPRALEGSAKGRGNIAGADGEVDLGGASIYSDIGEMFSKERLDAVSITVPTHLHAPWTIAALDAGLHVLCEKPMALNVADGVRMIEAADRNGRVLRIGHCIRFWPEYAKAKEIIDGGAYGRVLAATFQRLAATAHAKTGSWFTDEGQSGGMVLDLHIHDTDFIQHVFGMPRAVRSHGAPTPTGGLAHVVTHYCYDDDRLITAEGGWAMTRSFGFDMRFLIVLERAVIAFDYGHRPTLRLCPADGDVIVPPLGEGDGYSRQIEHFVGTILGRPLPTMITPRQALDSLRIVQAERESARKGIEVSIG